MPSLRGSGQGIDRGMIELSKKCSKCGEVKLLGDFNKNRYSKDGSSCHCKTCAKETTRKWNQENKDKHQEHRKKWKKLNVDLVNINTAKRRYARLKRTPFWLNAGQDFEMECIYKYCASLRSIGLDYEVDHIVPLQGKTVSGFHVPWNLQVITGAENSAKGNRLW